MELKQHYSVGYALELLCEIKAEGASAVKDYYEELQQLFQWLSLDRFSHHAVNRRLQQYAQGNQAWMFGE